MSAPAVRPAVPPVPPPPAEPEEESAQTFSVESPDVAPAPDTVAVPAPGAAEAAPGSPVRIALMLPLHSESLGVAAQFVRDGFMAAYERDGAGFTVSVIETGGPGEDVAVAYAQAQEQQDIVVGPLSRSAVTAVASGGKVRKPTIALNRPEGSATLPPQMLAIGLSIEDEAHDVAVWAAGEQPGTAALILSAGSPWQKRIASAFAAQWRQQGRSPQTVEMSAANGYLSDAELVQLRARVQNEAPALIFAALDADQVRQVRVALGPLGANIPVYGTSSLNPGMGFSGPAPELDGVRLLDVPWQVRRDDPAVMVYPQPVANGEASPTADMQRLYALGIDAFRVAREIALHPASRFNLDGVTGKLLISFGQGQAQFERTEQTVIYRDGVPVALPAALPLAQPDGAAARAVPAQPVAR
jgi:outer membrane PBP1 activator LpoA protein